MAKAQRIQRGRDDVRVMVRYTEAERESLASLDDMRVRTSEGSKFLFGPSQCFSGARLFKHQASGP